MIKRLSALIAALCFLCLAGCGTDTLLTGLGTTEKNTGIPVEGPGTEKMSDGELVGYLLANAEEAYKRSSAMHGGLEARVTGKTTRLPLEGACRDVLLGRASGGDFDAAIHYTIAPSGAIYKYFPAGDEWGVIYRPGYLG